MSAIPTKSVYNFRPREESDFVGTCAGVRARLMSGKLFPVAGSLHEIVFDAFRGGMLRAALHKGQ